MSYAKRNDIPVSPDETVVQLDSGELIAVGCDRKRVDSGVVYHACARAIDAAGSVLADPRGRPLATELKHTVPIEIVDAMGDSAIARECMLAVLGEPLTAAGDGTGLNLIPWSPMVLASASIRISLAAATVSGPADAGALL